MYLLFTVLCRAPSFHWSILNNEIHLLGSRLYSMVLVYEMANSCLYNKQNNTWTLGDMEFIFECSHSISHSFVPMYYSLCVLFKKFLFKKFNEIMQWLVVMILCCFQIINAPKKNQEDHLTEDEKAEKSVSFVSF